MESLGNPQGRGGQVGLHGGTARSPGRTRLPPSIHRDDLVSVGLEHVDDVAADSSGRPHDRDGPGCVRNRAASQAPRQRGLRFDAAHGRVSRPRDVIARLDDSSCSHLSLMRRMGGAEMDT
jgi:hypothetical protein